MIIPGLLILEEVVQLPSNGAFVRRPRQMAAGSRARFALALPAAQFLPGIKPGYTHARA
jgi:hypothetical protein